MIVTDDEAIVEAAHTYRDQGKGSFLANFHTRLGANWRMSEPHAAIVLSQLGRLDEFIAARQAIAKRYDAAVDDLGPAAAAHPGRRALQLLQVHRVPSRRHRPRRAEADDARALRRRALGRGLRHAAAPAAGVRARSPTDRCPGAEFIGARHICLPLYPSLSESDADYVVESLGTALNEMGQH